MPPFSRYRWQEKRGLLTVLDVCRVSLSVFRESNMTNRQVLSDTAPHPIAPERLGKLADQCQRVVISFNPNSGARDRRKLVDQLYEQLAERGMDVEIPRSPNELIEIATRYTQRGELRTVVAAGGDGTISMLVNQLPAHCPISILPLGTENLLAKYLGISADTEKLAQLIVDGQTVLLDVGRANGTCFMVMASCGFDADVVRRLHARRSGHIRHWSYAGPIMNSIGQYRFPKIKITLDDDPQPAIESKWAFVFNAPRYAMNLPIVEDANTMDGKLDLCTFRGGNFFRGLFYLAGISLRRHRGWKDCRFQRVRRLKLESDEQVPYQLDGDPGGFLPLEIEVVPAYLRIVVSSDWVVRASH